METTPGAPLPSRYHLDIFIPGEPKAQPRCRRSKWGGVYTPPTAKTWKALIRAAVPRANPLVTGPVRVSETFIFHRPQRLASRMDVLHTVKPDRDNCDKAVLDALKGIVWVDDCQVCSGQIKRYANPSEETGVILQIDEIAE